MVKVLSGLVVLVFLVLLYSPFYWMVCTSVKTLAESITIPPTFWPNSVTLASYGTIINEFSIIKNLAFTFGISLITSAGVVLTSVLAAFAMVYREQKKNPAIFFIFMFVIMIPFEVIVIQNYITVTRLGWYNKAVALIVPWIADGFSVVYLYNAFKGNPKELYDLSIMDGCGAFTFISRILIPFNMAHIVIVGLLSFLSSWNSLLWPLMVTDPGEMTMIQLVLASLKTELGVKYNLLMAACTISLVPILVLFIFMKNSIFKLTTGYYLK